MHLTMHALDAPDFPFQLNYDYVLVISPSPHYIETPAPKSHVPLSEDQKKEDLNDRRASYEGTFRTSFH